MSKIKYLSNRVNKLFKTGFFHIFSAQVINKIIAFSSGVFVIRFISKSDYGVYSYANNIISMFLLLNGFGAVSGLLQFGSENRHNQLKVQAYSKLAWKMGLTANVIISVMIVIYALFFDFKLKETAVILLFMSLRPITSYIYSQLEMGFRIRLQNKVFSGITTLNSILLISCTITGAYLYKLIGIVLFQYFAYIVSIIVAILVARKYGHMSKASIVLSSSEKNSFIKLSFVSSMNNGISQMVYLLDIFLIGIIIPSSEVIAAYKTGSTIPFAMNFIPMAIITYIFPYFASHNRDREWIRNKYYKLLKTLILFNGLIVSVMFLFAPEIIRGVFGANYMDSVVTFRILIIGYFIVATFRIPSGNILVSLRRVNFNFYNSILSGVVNIVLNIYLIKRLGSVGAAYATLLVYLLSSLISTIYLNKIINNRTKPLVE